MKERISKCCNAPVIVVGKITKHYECLFCHKPCDVKIVKTNKQKQLI